jgi:hypothetical protein
LANRVKGGASPCRYNSPNRGNDFLIPLKFSPKGFKLKSFLPLFIVMQIKDQRAMI